jgi:phosphatidylglycerophosphatase C
MGKTLVLFDFDGTLTNRDSMLEFTRFSCGNARFATGMLLLFPIMILYKAGLIPNWRTKEHFLTHFFGNIPVAQFQADCDRFALEKIPALLRAPAVMQLEAHQKNGARVIIVSSSAENWLDAWCRQRQVELIATRLQIKDGLVTGELKGLNCYGEEKVRRLKEILNPDEYSEIIAYGDSRGDFALFSIASSYFYKPFRG